MHSEAEQKSAESGTFEFIRIRYLSRKGRSEVNAVAILLPVDLSGEDVVHSELPCN